MRVTTKGQVTIPQDIRERLGILPHSEVEFDVVGFVVGMAGVFVFRKRSLDPWEPTPY